MRYAGKSSRPPRGSSGRFTTGGFSVDGAAELLDVDGAGSLPNAPADEEDVVGVGAIFAFLESGAAAAVTGVFLEGAGCCPLRASATPRHWMHAIAITNAPARRQERTEEGLKTATS